MDINECLNESTKRVLNNLTNNDFNIELEVNANNINGNKNCWEMQPTYKIIAPGQEINKAAFTHELLHIQLYLLGFMDANVIMKVVDDGTNIFSNDFITKLNNNLAHFKMLPKFLIHSFKSNEFLAKSIEEAKSELTTAEQYLSTNKKDCHWSHQFISIYSSVKFYEFLKLSDTSQLMKSIKDMDINLFEISEITFREWIDSNEDDCDNIKFFNNLKNRLIR